MTTGRCLDPDRAATFVAHGLRDSERSAVEEHVDACADCRRLLSEAVRETADHSGGYAIGAALPLGTQLGPYVVDEVVDAGGMGVVYAARDPRLGRQVAIKAVRSVGATSAELARLVTEAEAMARLAHPNVVAVHDLIERDGQCYLAMELVRGRSVRQWLAERPRGWREVIEVFVAAGDGLAAVHDAGLVHRDVKASNLLRGDDGRVRIADFGLAVAVERATAADAAGTPAYMAPEQRRGGPPDARGDQYAFCVALHEALYGALPARPPTRAPAVPRRIRAAIERGRSRDPSARFPTMRLLVAELAAGLRIRRAVWALVACAAAIAIATGALLAHRAAAARAALAACEAGDPLDGIWDAARRAEVERALHATGTPYAADAWPRVAAALDAWAAGYRAERHAACVATWRERTQPVAELARRLDCLGEHRRELRGVSEQLAHADATTASYAVTAVRLSPPATCARTANRSAAVNPARAAQLAALGDVRARVEALIRTGHAREALAPARAELAEAEHLDDPVSRAEALRQLGWVEGELSSYDAAETHLLAAITTAERAGRARTVAESWIRLLRIEHLRGRYDRLPVYRAQAEAAVEAGGSDPDQRASVLHIVGTMLAAQGRRDEAREVLRASLDDSPAISDRGTVLESLAVADVIAGDPRAAIEQFGQARVLIEQALGPSHPRLGYSHENLAVAWFDLLEPERARVEMRRALDIFVPALGTNRSVAIAYDILGIIELEAGDVEASAAHHREAQRMWQALGLAHPRRAFTELGQALDALAVNDPATAVDHAERAQLLGRDLAVPKDRAWITLELARALRAAHRDPARVRVLAREAAAIFESVMRTPRDERDLARARELAAR